MDSMENKLGAWLTEELNRRGWSYRELGRRSGLSHVTISNVISGSQSAGVEFCKGVARAFGVPDVVVLRKAGIIEKPPESLGAGEYISEMVSILKFLSIEDRKLLLDIAKSHYQRARPQQPDSEHEPAVETGT